MIVLLDIPNALLAELAARNPADLNYLILTVLREGLKAVPAESSQVHTPVSTQVHTPVYTKISTEPGSVAAVTDQQIEDAFDCLDWHDNSKRTGWFAELDLIPLPVRPAVVNRFLGANGKSIRIGGYTYSRFGDNGGLIGKFPAKAGGPTQ